MAKTILLADDSVTIQKVVELTFMDEDYEVVATGDGTSALEQLPDVRPDLVIADVHMPGADGYEVCRQTKENHPEIPVLLLVGTFEQFDEQKAASVGADGHLKKPFDSQDLLSQVDALIAGSGGSREAEAADETPPVATDDFGANAEQPQVGDLEPPPLEASSFAPAPTSFAPAPTSFAPAPTSFAPEPTSFAPEPEASSFATMPETPSFGSAPAPDVATPISVGDLNQNVTETAAVDINAIGIDTPTPELPAFDSADAAFETTGPVEDLEAPSLEAPPIEDFAPFTEEAVVEEPVADEPASWATIEPEAEVGVAEDAPAEDTAAEDSTVAEDAPAEDTSAEDTSAEDTSAEDIAAPEPVAEPEVAAVAPEVAVEASATEAPATAAANGSGPLSDDDIERIARRVAELVGEKALLSVAWEVLPDLAEVIIKERIRELESEVV